MECMIERASGNLASNPRPRRMENPVAASERQHFDSAVEAKDGRIFDKRNSAHRAFGLYK